jgi:phage tail sheath protein FI
MAFNTPGVYIREVEASPPPRVRLDITGCVGQAERGPLNFPQPLTSWGQFRDIFGGFTAYSFLSYTVFGFFLNGGERCYVVRVAHETARPATRAFHDARTAPLMRVSSINAGAWGKDLRVTIEDRSTDAGFTMLFRYQPGGTVVREEVFENLSLHPGHERYYVRVINGDPEEPDYVKRLRNGNSILVHVEDLCQGTGQVGARPQRVEAQALEDGDDGRTQELTASYYTGYDNGTYFRPVPPHADAAQRREIAAQFFGLATFETVLDVGLLAIPDLLLPDLYQYYKDKGHQPPMEGIIFGSIPPEDLKFDALQNLQNGQRDLLRHCETMGDRFAILDAPPGLQVGKGSARIEAWPNLFQGLSNNKYGALYYPWIKEKASDFDGREPFIPPSGHLAGIYARTEQTRGVGQTPANEILRGVIALEFSVSNAAQDLLNPRGVNCLRMLPGRGLRVWGARTLSPDPLWRYLNVQRVYLAIVKHIQLNLQWTVFEPNDRQLWAKITAALTLFLRGLFLQGALSGSTPNDAFFVQCNDETNPPEVVARGEVIAIIGFAPARPAEFILVTIKRTTAALSVSESLR